MTEIEDMLNAFEMHYGNLKYTPSQRVELTNRYRWLKPGYKLAVYDSVVSTHPASLRSLPDVALIEKAMNELGRPEVYEPQPLELEDNSGRFVDSVRDAMNERAKREGEPNHEERNRIRARVASGKATKYEAFWISAIDDHGGDWRMAMMRTGGTK